MSNTHAEAPRTPAQLVDLTLRTFGDGPLAQLVQAEARAIETPGSVITACTLDVVPAYLQTTGYTRSLFEEYDEVSLFKTEGLLIRQARRRLLGEAGVKRNVFVSPDVLRRAPNNDTDVLRQQLRMLNEVHLHPRQDLSLRVLRPEGVQHAGSSFVDVSVPGQESYVLLTDTGEDTPLTNPAKIAQYHEIATTGLGWRAMLEADSQFEVLRALNAPEISG